MATILPTFEMSLRHTPRIQWLDITTTTDTVTPHILEGQNGLAGAVQFEGTFGGSTVTLKGSVDGTTYFTLKDVFGNNITATASAMFEFTTSCPYIKPDVTGGAGNDVDVTICFRG